jgi:hypothetical protein
LLIEKPQKIRFSKREMKRIERLAADGECGFLPGPARSGRSILSRCSHAVLSICILLVLLVGAGFVILRSGIDSNLLRDEAQKSLTHISVMAHRLP